MLKKIKYNLKNIVFPFLVILLILGFLTRTFLCASQLNVLCYRMYQFIHNRMFFDLEYFICLIMIYYLICNVIVLCYREFKKRIEVKCNENKSSNDCSYVYVNDINIIKINRLRI